MQMLNIREFEGSDDSSHRLGDKGDYTEQTKLVCYF